MYKLSDSGTMIIPVTQVAFGEAVIGHINMFAKHEQHITVFNYPVGKLIMQSNRNCPSLVSDIEELVNNTDWSFQRTGKYYLMERGREIGELYTIIELIHVPAIDQFYKL